MNPIRNNTILVVLVAALVGGGVGWHLKPAESDHLFRTSKPTRIQSASGQTLGVLPAGTPLISELELQRGGETGWWGYVPVYFGTSAEASDLVVEAKALGRHVISEKNVVTAQPETK